MSSFEDLSLTPEDDISITSSVLADEALEAVDRTGSFTEAADDPTFDRIIRDLVTEEMVYIEPDGVAGLMLADLNSRLENRMSWLVAEMGMTESEARKRVKGEVLQGFVEVQLRKRSKEEF